MKTAEEVRFDAATGLTDVQRAWFIGYLHGVLLVGPITVAGFERGLVLAGEVTA
jgi:hypothetical protein